MNKNYIVQERSMESVKDFSFDSDSADNGQVQSFSYGEIILAIIILMFLWGNNLHAQQQMEKLGRGVIAMRNSNNQVYIGWRLLGNDPANIAFNLYRGATKLNETPITNSTNFVDSMGPGSTYTIKVVVNGIEQQQAYSANVTNGAYLNVPLQIPPGGVTPAGETYTYSANDASVGDVDGDGEYELILKWDPSNSKDNSQSGYTGNVYIDAYKMNGTRLWRIDLGKNIRAGAHYTQFMVYDLDGDGRAEVACRTADGTIDGTGIVIGDPLADFRSPYGYILAGPEYLTIFNGLTGRAMATADHQPERGDICSWGNDGAGRPECYGNRVDRFVSAVAYLDGKRPSLIIGRGYYDKLVRAAWDWRNGNLTLRWLFNSKDEGNNAFSNQGNHGLTVGDVDGDGKDEICNGASVIDDDGKGLWSSGLGHGDAHHMSDLDPDRPGLEIWLPSEYPAGNGNVGAALLDARTGEIIWKRTVATGDIGRAMAADMDPEFKGYEVWASGATGGVFDVKGNEISTTRPSINFGIWWDADLSRELLDGNRIDKWNPATKSAYNILTATGATSNNGTKATPTLSGDILGDWREEVILRATDNSALHIYTTTIPANNRLYTLMHNPQYRVAIAWQNTAYNQPPHPGFYLGTDMIVPPQTNIETVSATGIGEGNYLIKPTHTGLCLMANGNLSQQECDSANGNQVWKITKEDNFYNIYSAGAKKYMGFDKAVSEYNVVLTDESSKKLFNVIALEGGAMQIIASTDSSLVLTVDESGSVKLSPNTGANNQIFSLSQVQNAVDCNGDWNGSAYRDGCNLCIGGNTGRNACDASLATGVYNIKPFSASFCVQAEDTIRQQVCDTLDTQVWHVTKVGSVYEIFSKDAQKYLGFTSSSAGSKLVLSAEKTQYILAKSGENNFSITPTTNLTLAIEISGDAKVAGQTLQLMTVNGESQLFAFEKVITNLDCAGAWKGGAFVDDCGVCVAGNTGKQPCVTNFTTANYIIKAVSSNLCLAPGDILTQQVCDTTGSDFQQWKFHKEGGLYSISSASTGLYLSYEQAVNGANNIFTDSVSRKLFRIEAGPGGSYYIYPSDNLNIRFDVWERSIKPGAKISYWRLGTGTNQRFLIQIVREEASVAISGTSAIYSGLATPVTVTTDPSGLNVNVTYNGSAAIPADAGTYAVIATVEDQVYTGSAADTLVINKAPVTVTADNKSRLFAEENPTLTFTTSGFVNGEDSSVLDSIPVIFTPATLESPDGAYPITVSGGMDNNYNFIYQQGTLNISGRPDLSTQYRVRHNQSRPYDNHIRPHFRIVNNGSGAVSYSDLTIRYWYTKEGNASQAFWCDYSALGKWNIKGQFVTLPSPVSQADTYLEVSFTTNSTLAEKGNSGEIQTRFNKINWTDYNETNDYSFDPSKRDYTDWNKVTLYYKGVLIWGTEPAVTGDENGDGEENPEENKSTVYPNPFQSTFNIKAKGDFKYFIYNHFGKIKEVGAGKNEKAVGYKLTPGLYTIQIWQGFELTSIKVVKE